MIDSDTPRHSLSMPLSLQAAQLVPANAITAAASKHFFRFLAGSLGIQVLPESAESGYSCCIHLCNEAAFYSRLSRGFGLGLGEGYVAGDWYSHQLDEVLFRLAKCLVRLSNLPPFRLAAYFREVGARDHITAPTEGAANAAWHYGIDPSFFEAFLGPNMTYSSAYFGPGVRTLDEAQYLKIDQFLDVAQVGSGTTLLDIGSGWGTLAHRAARRSAKVTGITPVFQQVEYAIKRQRTAGLKNIEFYCRDYRSIEGEYDVITSVEMIEAVGYRGLPLFLDRVSAGLRPGGRLALQFISTSLSRMRSCIDRETWTRKYVFPGGDILASEYVLACAKENGLLLETTVDLTEHYVKTLESWRTALNNQFEVLSTASDAFKRTWLYYLSLSRAGFRAGDITCSQWILVKGDQ